MTEKIILTLVFLVGFTLICWTLMEYQIRAPRHATESNLKCRTFSAVERFCQALQQKKDFRSFWVKDEFGNSAMDEMYTPKYTSESPKAFTGQEEGSKERVKKFNMKIDM